MPGRIEADKLEQGLNLFLASVKGPTKEGWNQADVSFNRPMGEKPPILLNISDVATEGYGILLQGVPALNMYFAGGRLIQAIEQPQKGRFPRSALTNEHHRFPGMDGPVYIPKAEGPIRKLFGDVDSF